MKLIPLSQNKFAKVDDEDFEEMMKYKWFATERGKQFYAFRNFPQVNKIRNYVIFMHRQLVGLKRGDKPRIEVDHADGDGLNNQRSNIRKCTPSQNRFNRPKNFQNKSGMKGVSWSKGRNKWLAQIKSYGKARNLGAYHTKEEAYEAYCKAAKELHGEFARV